MAIRQKKGCELAGGKREFDVEHSASLHPEDLLHFIYLDEFLDDWKELFPQDHDESSMWELEVSIMANPTLCPVISKTGALRKARWKTDTSNHGKRGGIRICYAYFPEHHSVVMVIAFDKKEKQDISEADKPGIKTILVQGHFLRMKLRHCATN